VNRWLVGARPLTLPAAVVPVLVGTAAAEAEAGGDALVSWRAGAALVVSLALQVGTNYANDYSDGVRGTDEERVGPVRLVAGGLATPAEVKRAAALAFAVALLAGLALAVAVGPELVPVGVASVAAGVLYTGGPRPYGYAGLGEVFVFVFFGLVATVGSSYVHLDRLTGLSVLAAVPVGLMATALLVVNNLRDIPTDERSGKRTLAVKLGAAATGRLYAGLVAAAVVSAGAVSLTGRPAVLVVVLAAPSLAYAARRVLSGAAGPDLVAVLSDTGRLHLLLGLLLGLALWRG
jgi:1,4-dihydroxy-2-naphthoate octaprenyltransferase